MNMEIFGFVLSPADLWLLGICGTLGTFLVGYWLTGWHNRRNALRSAVHAYKGAFASGIAAISNNSFAIDAFSIDFLQHKAAVDAVRPILPKRSQRKLQRAWDDYRGKENGLGFDDQGYVAAASATIYTTDKALFDDFKRRFDALHGSLDEWV